MLLLASGTARPGVARGQSANATTLHEVNQRYLETFKRLIAGHENEPAGQTFKNVQFLKATTAGTLLVIMNVGYAQALGVTCEHCHVADDFASDDKRPKRAAREMQAMHKMINDRLATLTETTGDVKAINCSTCHRGSITTQPAR
jgi:anion-transporting  ArsA/GET3 family ATPase